jgi:hypothetical protein
VQYVAIQDVVADSLDQNSFRSAELGPLKSERGNRKDEALDTIDSSIAGRHPRSSCGFWFIGGADSIACRNDRSDDASS